MGLSLLVFGEFSVPYFCMFCSLNDAVNDYVATNDWIMNRNVEGNGRGVT